VVPIRQLGFISRFTKSIKKYLLQPFVVGFAVALGMSFGTCPCSHYNQINREILLHACPFHVFTGYSAYDAIVHRVATFWKS
jgi:hypothetical protein